MRPTFDDKDGEILKRKQSAWDAQPGARVGDWLDMLDGTRRRFTHDWDDGLQTTLAGNEDSRFFFGDGYMEFSGSLAPVVPLTEIVPTAETRLGYAWFFHHDHCTAQNGVPCEVTCRVFRQVSPRRAIHD